MEENTETLQREKPSPQLVLCLMNMYPKLDYLMAETILSLSEEQLGETLDEQAKKQEKSQAKSIEENDDETCEVE